MATTTQLRVSGLPSPRLAELNKQAKHLGLSASQYARELIEDGLAIQREARTKTFDEILAPIRNRVGQIDENELDQLVDRARTRHHERSKRTRR